MVKRNKVGLAEMARSFIYTGMAKTKVQEADLVKNPYSDKKTVSNIDTEWQRPEDVKRDVVTFLFNFYQDNMGEDFATDDMIKAIENGIKEFRKATRL